MGKLHFCFAFNRNLNGGDSVSKKKNVSPSVAAAARPAAYGSVPGGAALMM